MSSAKLHGYQSMVNTLIDLIAKDIICFHVLVADTRTMDHKAYNQGDREAGFNKLIYQLLLHKCGRRHGRLYRFEAHLDRRYTNQDPETMRQMLNAHLARDYEISHRPFRSIVFRDSKDCDLIQLCDLLIGAIAYRKNRHYLEPGANVAKCELAAHIIRRLHGLEAPVRPTKPAAKKFTYWEFRYSGRGTPQA